MLWLWCSGCSVTIVGRGTHRNACCRGRHTRPTYGLSLAVGQRPTIWVVNASVLWQAENCLQLGISKRVPCIAQLFLVGHVTIPHACILDYQSFNLTLPELFAHVCCQRGSTVQEGCLALRPDLWKVSRG